MLRNFSQTYIEKRTNLDENFSRLKKRKKCLMFIILWIKEIKVAK